MGIAGDVKNSNEGLDIDFHLGFYEENESKKLGYWQGLVTNVDEDKPSSYQMRNGICLLHLLIVQGYDKLVEEYLKKIKYGESYFSIDPSVNPLKIALKLNDPKILDSLAYSVGTDPCLEFNEEIFFRTLKSSSENFRKMISNSLFYHKQLNIKRLPTTAILIPEKMPLCFLSEETLLTDTKLKEKIKKFEEDGEPVTLKVRRSFLKANWSFKNLFVLRFVDEYGKNAVKVIDNDTIHLVRYLWKRYRWLAVIFSIIYFIFMATTILTVIWCNDADSCEEFIDLGPLNLAFLIIIRVLMFSTYLFLVFLEVLSLVSKKLDHVLNFYNFVDFLVLAGFIPIIILVLVDSSKQPDRVPNTFIAIYLVFVCLRGMSQLRVIDSVRYLVAMIMRVFFDMIPFLTVLFFTIGCFAVIETQISKPTGDFETKYGFFFKKLN